MGLTLPDGYSAWAKDGRPVRRAVTKTLRTYETALGGVPPGELSALNVDAMVSGDAWVDMEGRRVAPHDVIVQPSEDSV